MIDFDKILEKYRSQVEKSLNPIKQLPRHKSYISKYNNIIEILIGLIADYYVNKYS